MGLLRKKKKKRVCVIGLDGVPYSLLTDLSKGGVLPFFTTLMDSEGILHSMKASLPEISSVSWTDFMTGKNSGEHGIFGFTDLKKNSYDMHFPNFLDVKTDTFWDTLGREGKKSIIINQPSTYPARKLSGILVSGFVAIELGKAVFPLTRKPALERIGYEIDIDTFKSREDHDFLWKELDRTFEGRIKAFKLFWEESWDYFQIVITGTDRLQHFLWNAYRDTGHPHHQRFLDYYRRIDDVIRIVASAFEKLTGSLDGLFLLSDHGFTGIEQEVYLNTWLKKENYLFFENDDPKNLGDLSGKTLAFAMDPNRIYIHTRDKYPKGALTLRDKTSLKTELSEKLSGLEYQGKKVVKKVIDTDVIYQGPYVGEGPDLIVLSEHGFDMKGSIKKKDLFGRSNLQGMHTWDDAFVWAARQLGDDLHISQISEFILEHLQ